MLMIRLQRIGKNKHPSYRIIVSEKKKDPHAGHLEILGVYNPSVAPKIIDIKKDRVTYWLSVGAQPSSTLHNLFIQCGLTTGKKQRAVHVSTKRRAALQKKKTAA